VVAGLLLASPARADGVLTPEILAAETYAESFTAITDLDDGTFLLLQVAFSNVGLGDGHGACRLLWVTPDGGSTNDVGGVDRSEWRSTGSQLSVGGCTLTDGEAFTFSARLEERQAELRIPRPLQPRTPPGARVDAGDRFFESELLIADAPVSARLSSPAGERTVAGRVVVDHTRSTALPPQVARGWARFRGMRGDRPVLIEVRFAPDGLPVGWIWWRGETAPAPLPRALPSESADGHLTIQTAQGTLTMVPGRELYMYRPVAELGRIGVLARPFIGDPTTTTTRGTLLNAEGVPVAAGIMERSTIRP